MSSREGSTERKRTIYLDIWQEGHSNQREQQVQRLCSGSLPGTVRISAWAEKNKQQGPGRGERQVGDADTW